jgi:hypothetical protein
VDINAALRASVKSVLDQLIERDDVRADKLRPEFQNGTGRYFEQV